MCYYCKKTILNKVNTFIMHHARSRHTDIKAKARVWIVTLLQSFSKQSDQHCSPVSPSGSPPHPVVAPFSSNLNWLLLGWIQGFSDCPLQWIDPEYKIRTDTENQNVGPVINYLNNLPQHLVGMLSIADEYRASFLELWLTTCLKEPIGTSCTYLQGHFLRFG